MGRTWIFQEKNGWSLLPAEFREGEKVGEVGMLHLVAPVLSHDGLLGREGSRPAWGRVRWFPVSSDCCPTLSRGSQAPSSFRLLLNIHKLCQGFEPSQNLLMLFAACNMNYCILQNSGGFPGGSVVKNLPAMQETWRHRFNPWVGKIPWRRKWQPAPVFLPGETHGQRSLVDYIVHGVAKNRTPLSMHAWVLWSVALNAQYELLYTSASSAASLLQNFILHNLECLAVLQTTMIFQASILVCGLLCLKCFFSPLLENVFIQVCAHCSM